MRNDITLLNVRSLKHEMEQKIGAMLHDFYERTGLEVAEIRIDEEKPPHLRVKCIVPVSL
jgi:hypothetical protein